MNRTMLFSALRPHREMEDRLRLDWHPRFLEGAARRAVLGRWEYSGSDIPCDALDLEQHRYKSIPLGGAA